MALGWWAWVLVGIGVSAVLALVVTWVPDQLVQHDIRRSTRKRPLSETPTATDRLKARTDARNSLLQSISVLGIAAGLVVTIVQVTSTQESAQRQLRVAEIQQERDRFNAAVENLSSRDHRSIRLGGVHTLATLLDSPEFKDAALAVLALYISENAAPGTPGVAVSLRADQPDVEAAIREGCRASHGTDFGDLVSLDGKNLVDMDLSGCDLAGASLREAHGVDLELIESNLSYADFEAADLASAEFFDANLFSANLGSTDLRGAGLHGANLREADLRGADLSGADVSAANFELAWANSNTKWPSGFDPNEAGVTMVE